MDTIKKWFTNKKKNKTQKKKKSQMNCSPVVENSRVNDESCFTPEILIKIRDEYNKKNPQKKIQENDPNKLWYLLKERLSCDREQCLLSQLDNQEQIKRFIFAPKHPPEWNSNPDEWLSNIDIEEVAKQYEVSNPEFKIIGPTTIDFDTRLPERDGKCVLEDLCQFSLERFIRAKKTKIGIVFNLDKHDQSGSHWVSLFIDIEQKFMFFFDSADNSIPPEIWQKDPKNKERLPLVNRIIEQGKALSKPIHFRFYNNRGHSHQRSNTECGMYSLFFIITMLTGKIKSSPKILSFRARRNLFLKKRIPDEVMLQFRKLYFND
jgi:hypothetical protein